MLNWLGRYVVPFAVGFAYGAMVSLIIVVALKGEDVATLPASVAVVLGGFTCGGTTLAISLDVVAGVSQYKLTRSASFAGVGTIFITNLVAIAINDGSGGPIALCGICMGVAFIIGSLIGVDPGIGKAQR